MKKLVLIAFALFSLTISAQPGSHYEKGHKKEMAENSKDWSPEQRAVLATKKMTLALSLSEAQQHKIYPIHLEVSKERMAMRAQKEKKEELSSDELFERKNAHLEKQIQLKQQFKSILTPEQFEKWEAAHHKGKRQPRPQEHNR